MTTIYVSSTVKDLVKYREAVAGILRKMNKVVVAMEDYTASDERPLDKCLADVERCDMYVGIFAQRYGFIPQRDNPDRFLLVIDAAEEIFEASVDARRQFLRILSEIADR
jgi:hypothetical protein